jgi:hypothetical protein
MEENIAATVVATAAIQLRRPATRTTDLSGSLWVPATGSRAIRRNGANTLREGVIKLCLPVLVPVHYPMLAIL